MYVYMHVYAYMHTILYSIHTHTHTHKHKHTHTHLLLLLFKKVLSFLITLFNNVDSLKLSLLFLVDIECIFYFFCTITYQYF